MTAVEPFRVAIADSTLADLRERLQRTRWPEAETVCPSLPGDGVSDKPAAGV